MRNRIVAGAAAAALGVATALAGASPAAADSTDVTVLAEEGPITVTQASCDDGGEVIVAIEDGWPFHVASETRTAGLAARGGDQLVYQEQEPAVNGPHATEGDQVAIGPFEGDTTVEFRWFAGPERNDLPAWDATGPADDGWADVVDEVESREAAEDRFWDARDDADFVNWYEVMAKGCPTEEPTDEPSDEPTDEPEIEDTGAKDSLADTGAPVAAMFAAAAVLVVAGGGLWLVARRRGVTFTS